PTTGSLTPGRDLEGGPGDDRPGPLHARREERNTMARVTRFVDEHPLAAMGAAMFSGAVLGRITRGSGPSRAGVLGIGAVGLLGTAARAAIRAAAISMITRRVAKSMSGGHADDKSHPNY
ncbi:MAG TPA: hypothetical protein VML75_02765, partial [Kofleriaceae bacterium]|nr:hypothetical protein [Kofleriaceae bacterium]